MMMRVDMSNRATGCRSSDGVVMGKMPGKRANGGPFQAASRFSRRTQANRQGKSARGNCIFHQHFLLSQKSTFNYLDVRRDDIHRSSLNSLAFATMRRPCRVHDYAPHAALGWQTHERRAPFADLTPFKRPKADRGSSEKYHPENHCSMAMLKL